MVSRTNEYLTRLRIGKEDHVVSGGNGWNFRSRTSERSQTYEADSLGKTHQSRFD